MKPKELNSMYVCFFIGAKMGDMDSEWYTWKGMIALLFLGETDTWLVK